MKMQKNYISIEEFENTIREIKTKYGKYADFEKFCVQEKKGCHDEFDVEDNKYGINFKKKIIYIYFGDR